MRFTLGLTGLLDSFDGLIFSAEDVEHGKPAPDLFLHAASCLGVDPSSCVVVEDSRSGVQAASAAGMRSLGYSGGLTPPASLEGPGTVVFDDMADLPRLIGSHWEPEAKPPSLVGDVSIRDVRRGVPQTVSNLDAARHGVEFEAMPTPGARR